MQRLGDGDAAVGLLVGLDQRHEQAGQCSAAAVEDVRVPVFAVGILVAQVHPAGLVVFAVGATGDLEVVALARCPHLDVVGGGAAEAHVGGAKLEDAVVQVERLQNLLSVAEHFLEFVVAAIRLDDLDEFHLVKLVDADHAAGADPGRAGLGSEARAVGAVIFRQLLVF